MTLVGLVLSFDYNNNNISYSGVNVELSTFQKYRTKNLFEIQSEEKIQTWCTLIYRSATHTILVYRALDPRN